jgi:hypothetical protein
VKKETFLQKNDMDCEKGWKEVGRKEGEEVSMRDA